MSAFTAHFLFIRNRVRKSALGAGLVTELGVANDHLKASAQLRTRQLEVSLENPAPLLKFS